MKKLTDQEKYMKEAYKQAQKAYKKLETPVGAVIVKNDKIIARAYNLRQSKNNSLYHAEILCINKACKKLNTWHLDNCQMYVTLEPCPMCAGAIIQSRIKKVYIGALDNKNGSVKSVANLFDLKFTHKVEYQIGLMQSECSQILSDFFKDLRKNKNNIKDSSKKS